MRRFLIKNEKNDIIELQGGSIFYFNPSGLGFSTNRSYYETNGYFIKTREQLNQVSQNGTILFYPNNAYKSYQDFINWVFAAKQLTLGYKPYGNNWYYIDVDIQSMDKSELKGAGQLEIRTVFVPLSPWYLPNSITIHSSEPVEVENPKRYVYKYPYRYENSTAQNEIEFTISANMQSDFSITINGPLTSPYFNAYRTDTDEMLGRVSFPNYNLADGAQIVFNTSPLKCGAFLIEGSTETNITNSLGLTANTTFFQIPPNVPILFELGSNSADVIDAELTIKQYYRSI